MKMVKKLDLKNLEQVSTRDGFGKGLLEVAARNKNVVAVSADLAESVRMNWFEEKYPERFVECGVAEQNMVTVAAGLAVAGKIPFVSSFAVFCPGRTWEQIRTTIAYNDVPVKIVGGHAGITTGPDGATHQAIEDIATMRVMPNMNVVVPCDAEEMRRVTIECVKDKSPYYIRMGRDKVPVITSKKDKFVLGRGRVMVDGKDCTIIACGRMVYEALVAARELAKKKISVRVVNMASVKPIDSKLIVASAKKTGCVVTCEEHSVIGGLGSAVCEVLSEKYPVPIVRVGVKDKFGESGGSLELMKKYGIDSGSIVKAVLKGPAISSDN